MNDILDLVSASDPVLAALALNAIGFVLNKTPVIDNKWIPAVLMLLGAVVYPLLTAGNPRNVIVGLVIGAGSVGFNQLLRQHFPPDEKDPPAPNPARN